MNILNLVVIIVLVVFIYLVYRYLSKESFITQKENEENIAKFEQEIQDKFDEKKLDFTAPNGMSEFINNDLKLKVLYDLKELDKNYFSGKVNKFVGDKMDYEERDEISNLLNNIKNGLIFKLESMGPGPNGPGPNGPSPNGPGPIGPGPIGPGAGEDYDPKAMERILEIESQIQVKKEEIRTAFESENEGENYYDSSLYNIEDELMNIPIAELDSLADDYFQSQIEDRSINLDNKLQSVLDALNEISNLRIKLDEAKKALETPVKTSTTQTKTENSGPPKAGNGSSVTTTEVEEEDNKPSEPATEGNTTTGSLTGGNTPSEPVTGGNTPSEPVTGGNTTTGILNGVNASTTTSVGILAEGAENAAAGLVTATSPTFTGSGMPEAEFIVPNDPDITTGVKVEDTIMPAPTINVNSFMFDGKIKTYKEKKLNIQKFVNDLMSLLGSTQNIITFTEFENIINVLETSYSNDYRSYLEILRSNFDLYKSLIGTDNLKLEKQLRVLLSRGLILDNIPKLNWPCMYYNAGSCPKDRCVVEEDNRNPDDGNKLYTKVTCIPKETVTVDQCTGYYGEKNCKMHKVLEELPGFTTEKECQFIGSKCGINFSETPECNDNLLNIYGNGVLFDKVIATKCITDEELKTLAPKHINPKSLSDIDEIESIKELCISNPNGRWNDDLKQCYDSSDCYSRNSDTCEIDRNKCVWNNLFFTPSSEDGKYIPQGFCLAK